MELAAANAAAEAQMLERSAHFMEHSFAVEGEYAAKADSGVKGMDAGAAHLPVKQANAVTKTQDTAQMMERSMNHPDASEMAAAARSSGKPLPYNWYGKYDPYAGYGSYKGAKGAEMEMEMGKGQGKGVMGA